MNKYNTKMSLLKKIRLKRLLKTLLSRDATTHKRQAKAIKAIGTIGGPLAFDALVNKLSFYPEAAEALGKLGDKSAIPHLITALCSRDANLRIEAANALEKLGQPEWKNIIQGDDEGDFQRLAKCGNEYILISLIEGAAGYRQVKSALIKTEDPLVAKTVRDCLDKHQCRNIDCLIDILAGLRDPLALTVLEKYYYRRSAIIAMAEIGDKNAIPFLIKGLTYLDGSVRSEAAKALTKLGDNQWEDIIKKNNSDFERLGKTRDPRLLQPLIKVLNSNFTPRSIVRSYKLDTSYLERRVSAAIGLGKLGSPAAIQALVGVLDTDSVLLRKAAALALSELGDPFWENIIKGDQEDINRLAASLNPKAIKLLIRFISNYNYNLDLHDEAKMAEMAISAVEKLKHHDALEILIDTLENTKNDDFIRYYAVRALGNSGDLRSVDPLIKSLKTLRLNTKRSYIDDKYEGKGERWIVVRYRSDMEIIEALGNTGDRKVVNAIADQVRLVEELIKTTQPEKEGRESDRNLRIGPYLTIKDQEEKIETIILALKKIGGNEAVEPLSGLLSFQSNRVRKQAAETLIGLAKKEFSTFSRQWTAIKSKITTPHNDQIDGETSIFNCVHTDTFVHTDLGIGLEIPPELKID